MIRTTPYSNEELQAAAPSIFATSAMQGVSDRYSFLPTSEVVNGLRHAGWLPVHATEQRVNLAERRGFQKHMIRFRRNEDHARIEKARESFTKEGTQVYVPEIVLINSHDRSSAYKIHAGLFRLVCGNGLIVADSTFGSISLRHTDFNPSKVIEGSFKILEDVPKIMANVDEMKSRQLTAPEATAFAEAALIVKYDSVEAAPVRAEKLLKARRSEDNSQDLWTTFNRVQENMVNGGLKDYGKRKENGDVFKRTKAVKGIDESVRLNKALWHLAEALKKA